MKNLNCGGSMLLLYGLRNPSHHHHHRLLHVRYLSDKIDKPKDSDPQSIKGVDNNKVNSSKNSSNEDGSSDLLKKISEINSAEQLRNSLIPRQHMSFEDARAAAQKAYALQRQHLEDRFEGIKSIFSGQPDDTKRTPEQEWYYKKVSFWMKRYENFVGLTEVKAAQARVVEAERRFIQMQEKRREAQHQVSEIRKTIKDIHLELEKTHRGEDRYLVLVTQEHNVLKEERGYMEAFSAFEKGEREYFSALSNAVRDSHEKERAQAEKTKYWSVLGSILGTCLGILGTTINNRMRMNELRQLVARNSTVEEVQAIGAELKDSLDNHEKELSSLTVQVETILNQAKTSLVGLSKIDGLAESLAVTGDKFNLRLIEEALEKLECRQENIADIVARHRTAVDERIEEIKSDIFVQSTNVGKLAHIQLKDRERDAALGAERDNTMRQAFEAMRLQSTELQRIISAYSKDIEDKIKDVRSLLLADKSRLPTAAAADSSRRVLEQRLTGLEQGQAKLLMATTSTAMASNVSSDGMGQNSLLLANILEDHHKRTRQTVILSTLMVAVLTPVAVYAINNLI